MELISKKKFVKKKSSIFQNFSEGPPKNGKISSCDTFCHFGSKLSLLDTMLFGIIWSAFLEEKNEIEEFNSFWENPFFLLKLSKKCLPNERAKKICVFLALDYNKMFRKEIEHKKTKNFLKITISLKRTKIFPKP